MMFNAETEQRLKAIDKELLKVALIDAPGTVLLGLGLYAKYVAKGDAFHPLLNNPSNVNVIIIVGGAIVVWGMYKIFSLSREKNALKKANEQQ